MQRWQQRLLAIIIVLLVIVLGFDVSLYHAIQYEPSELAVNYRNIKDDKIPTSMNDVSILYFTDLQYGKFEDKERCDRVFAKIKELNPDILILDEPTNHLDIHSVEWLEDFIASFKGSVIIISHDRYFLDKVIK